MDIISIYQQVGSYRGTAAICGTTPKTVRRVIARAEAGGTASPRVRRVRNYESVAGLVAAKIASSSGRISAKRLLPAARAAGFTGSARNFRRLVTGAKVEWRREDHSRDSLTATGNAERAACLPTWLDQRNPERPRLGIGRQRPIDRLNNAAGQYS